MDTFGPFRAILFLHLAVLPNIVVKSDISCTMVSGDYCKFTLGGDATDTIDLSPVFSNGQLVAKGGGNGYLYDACKGVSCDDPCTTDPCAACQNADKKYGIGSLSSVSCNTSEIDPSTNKWNIILSYTGGADTRQSEFKFRYSPSDATPEMTFDKEHPELHYRLTVHASFDVSKGSGSAADIAGIPGIVLIVLLIVAIVAYIVIGVIINATVRGARGVEMIPNLSFWKDFPYLLKDGFLFTFTCPCLRKKNTRLSMNY